MHATQAVVPQQGEAKKRLTTAARAWTTWLLRRAWAAKQETCDRLAPTTARSMGRATRAVGWAATAPLRAPATDACAPAAFKDAISEWKLLNCGTNAGECMHAEKNFHRSMRAINAEANSCCTAFMRLNLQYQIERRAAAV